MFRPIHFAARDPIYKKFVESLVPYEECLRNGNITRKMIDLIIRGIWEKAVRKNLRENLRTFIRNDAQNILKHIADIKKNKDAVIVHRSVAAREQFFESLATAMIPYEEILKSNSTVSLDIVKIVAKYTDGTRIGESRIKNVQNYIYHHKSAILKRISELKRKTVEKNVTSIPEVTIVEEIKAVKHAASSQLQGHRHEDTKDIETVNRIRPRSSSHRKRYREVEEVEEIKEMEISASSPCRKRPRLMDDLDFARWCLKEIRPIFGASQIFGSFLN